MAGDKGMMFQYGGLFLIGKEIILHSAISKLKITDKGA